MTTFSGTGGNDTANSAMGILDGFTGGTVADLTDGVGDIIIGGDGDDFVFAGSANDRIEGGAGFDLLNGAEGNDVIIANTSADQSGIGDELVGNLGDDQLYGSSGADSLFGSDGDDGLRGGGGADALYGGDGDDFLVFSPGDVAAGETIDGGAGLDTINIAGAVTFSNAASIAGIERVVLYNTAIDPTGTTATFGANQIKTIPSGSLHIVNDPGTSGAITFRIEMGAETSIDVPELTFDNWLPNDRIEIVGDADNEVVLGTAQIDHIFGNGGDDTLIGTGGDQLFGGLGDDVYHLDPAGDNIFELPGEGNDSVHSYFSQTLAANVENLVLLGTGHVNGTGNNLANTIVGSSGNNVLDGGAGADGLQGGLGNDTYVVDNAGDVVSEAAGAGADTVQSSVNFTLAAGIQIETLTTTNAAGTAAIKLTGNEFANVLIGNAGANTLKGLDGNDTLNGNAGADAMTGGAGNDTYIVDAVGDAVVEAAGQGTDTVQSSITETLSANLEKLVLTWVADINGIGNTLANTLIGNAGNNILDGLVGNDIMRGGLGNDTYRVDNASDIAIESGGQGNDWVQAGISFTLANSIEKLTLTRVSAINGTGNGLANTLVGNTANNVLDGKGGIDTISGGDGNDRYVVDNVADVVIEGAGKGTDHVQASASHILASNVERLTLTGVGNIGGTGNSLNNIIVGNAGNNLIAGKAGRDTLTGGGGGDIFLFDTAPNLSTNFDTVADFNVAADTFRLDRSIFAALGLGTLSADAFIAGTAAADAEDRIIYNTTADTLLYDRDGTGAAAAVAFAHVNGNPALTNADFVVVA